jgi:hypothetical protein
LKNAPVCKKKRKKDLGSNGKIGFSKIYTDFTAGQKYFGILCKKNRRGL